MTIGEIIFMVILGALIGPPILTIIAMIWIHCVAAVIDCWRNR